MGAAPAPCTLPIAAHGAASHRGCLGRSRARPPRWARADPPDPFLRFRRAAPWPRRHHRAPGGASRPCSRCWPPARAPSSPRSSVRVTGLWGGVPGWGAPREEADGGAVVAVTPLDVVKIRLQAQRTPFSKGTPLAAGTSPLVPGRTGPWWGRCCRGPPLILLPLVMAPCWSWASAAGLGGGLGVLWRLPIPWTCCLLCCCPSCGAAPCSSGCQKGADPSTPQRTPGTASGLPAAPVWCRQGSVPSPFLLGAGGCPIPGAPLSLSPLCFSVVSALGALGGLSGRHV